MKSKEEVMQLVTAVCDALDDKKGSDIVVLDISKITVLSDYFVIVTGNNVNHMKTLVENVKDRMEKCGRHIKHQEGAGSWILLDYGDFIVHVFNSEDREFYNLEHIWGDADVVSLAAPGIY